MNNLIEVPLSAGTGSGYSQKSNASNLLNMCFFKDMAGSKTRVSIVNADGAQKINTTTSQIFGIYEFKDEIYAFTRSGIEKLTNGKFNVISSITLADTVSIADNGIDIVIVDGSYGYAFNPETLVLKNMESEEGWYNSSTVAYMDGYFIFNRDGTGEFFISKLYSTELNPLDWATGESAPDDTIAVVVSNRVLWVIGERTVEAWYDSGDPDFPFTRLSGGVVEIGVSSKRSVAKMRDSIFFVGNDFRVYFTKGYTPVAISTPGVEKDIRKSGVDSLRAFTYTSNGLWYYVLHNDGKYTYVYDMTTMMWHTRTTGDMEKWFIDGALNVAYRYRAVGYFENTLYALGIDYFKDGDIPIKREIISLPLNKTVNRMVISEAILDMEVAQEENAEIALYTSKDGGRVWSNRHSAYTGGRGEHLQRVRWLRLGQFRDCIFKITTFSPIPLRILGLHIRGK